MHNLHVQFENNTNEKSGFQHFSWYGDSQNSPTLRGRILHSRIENSNAIGQSFKSGVFKAIGRKLVLDILGGRKDSNGFSQVVKRLGGSCDDLSGSWKKMEGIEVINISDPLCPGNGKFQSQEFPAISQNPMNFLKASLQEHKIAYAIADNDGIETVVGKTHVFRIPLDPDNTPFQLSTKGFLPSGDDHGPADVADDHLSCGFHLPGCQYGEIPCASAKIQNPVPIFKVQALQGNPSPEKVQTETQKRIRQIVAIRNRFKVSEHQPCLFPWRYFSVSIGNFFIQQILL